MSKRTYTPSLEELTHKYGENYFYVSIGRKHRPHEAFIIFGDLENIIDMMETTIYDIDPDADPADYSARISYGNRELIHMPDCAGPDSAQVMPQQAGDQYEVRQVDAWTEYDDPDEAPAWIYNTTYNLGTFTTTGDPAQALRRYLKRHHNITFYRGRTRTEYDGDVYEICDRKTGEPLFCAIPTA